MPATRSNHQRLGGFRLMAVLNSRASAAGSRPASRPCNSMPRTSAARRCLSFRSPYESARRTSRTGGSAWTSRRLESVAASWTMAPRSRDDAAAMPTINQLGVRRSPATVRSNFAEDLRIDAELFDADRRRDRLDHGDLGPVRPDVQVVDDRRLRQIERDPLESLAIMSRIRSGGAVTPPAAPAPRRPAPTGSTTFDATGGAPPADGGAFAVAIGADHDFEQARPDPPRNPGCGDHRRPPSGFRPFECGLQPQPWP